METSWGLMKLARRNQQQPGDEAADLDEQAEMLARALNGRFSGELQRNPVVTALALAKCDRMLPKRLMDVWQGLMPLPGAQRAPLSPAEMRKQAQVLRNRADIIEAEAAERDKKGAEALKAEERWREAKADQQALEAGRLAWEKMTPEERQAEAEKAWEQF